MKRSLNLASIVTLGYACLFILGYASNYGYWKTFSVSITDFFTEIELLLSFVPHLPILILLPVALIYLYIILILLSFFCVSCREYKRRWGKIILTGIFIIVLFVVLFVFLYDDKGMFNLRVQNFTFIILSALLYLFSSSIKSSYMKITQDKSTLILFRPFKNKNVNDEKLIEKLSNFFRILYKVRNYVCAIIFMLLLVFLYYWHQRSIGEDVINKKYITNTVSFEYHDKQIETDNNFIYIGSSYNYVFCYNIDDRKTFVYDKSHIKDYQISRFDYIKK